MCLAVPMKIVSLDEAAVAAGAASGVAELDGVKYDVNLSLVDEPALGDYVIVHAGYAIEKLDTEEADARIQLFADLAATNAEPGGPGDGGPGNAGGDGA